MHSKRFNMQYNSHGAITSLIDQEDTYQMNWVINPSYLDKAGYTDSDKLFGEFEIVIGDHHYKSIELTPVIKETSEQLIVKYQLPEATITLNYELINDQLQWQILLQNNTYEPVKITSLGVWCSLAYIMFRDRDVLQNIHRSTAVFPSVAPNFTKLAGMRRDNEGKNMGLFQTAGVVQSVGTACEWTNRFFENVSPSLDGMLFHQLILAGGYPQTKAPKRDWIYPHSSITLTDEMKWSFVLTPFSDQDNFTDVAQHFGHPRITYPPIIIRNQTATVMIEEPTNDLVERIVLRTNVDNKIIERDVTSSLKQNVLTLAPTEVGEHELRITLESSRQDRIVFNVMPPIHQLIQQRVDWLSIHSFEDASGKHPYSFGPVSNQGESLGKLSLILMANLLNPTEKTMAQVRQVEQSAVYYIRQKWFVDGDFGKPASLYGDFYRVMDFEYIGHVYYLLSLFGENVLILNQPTVYLHWAADVFNLRVNPDMHESQRAKEESQMLGVYFLYIDGLLNDLKAHGMNEDYQLIKECWDKAVKRVATDSQSYKAAITEHFYDNAGFGPATGALANAGYTKAASRYAELLKANIGFSNDFRSQAPDRWWEALSYMIHSLWGGITAASSLLAYEKMGDTELLRGAYRAFAGVLYMYDANATTTDRLLKHGEAASTYSIAGPNINRPDLSRNRFGQSVFAQDGGIFTRLFPDGDTGHDDWDMGEELAAYLTGFGQKAYVYTKADGTLSVINGNLVKLRQDEYRVTSYAPYPREILDVERNRCLKTSSETVRYNIQDGFKTDEG